MLFQSYVQSLTFALNVTRPEKLVAVRDDLVAQGWIIIRQQSGQATENLDAWAIDGEVWIAGTKWDELSDADQRELYVDLRNIFERILGEGIPCTQRRRMELFYNHARLVGI